MADVDEQSARAAIQQAADLATTDPDQALEVLATAGSARLRRSDPTTSARAGYLRARLLAERGEYDAALRAIRAARRDWLSAGRVLDAMSTDLGKATVHHELGEYRASIEVSEALLDALGQMHLEPDQLATASSVRARAHNNLGNSWGRLGDHTVALRHYDVASNLFRALDMPEMQSETDANRGLAYLRLGMAHRALDELERAEHSLRRLDRQRAAAKCRVDIAEAHLSLDQVGIAIDLLSGTRPVLDDLHAVPELARLGLVLGTALLRAGQPGAAHREATEAADTFADLSMVGESARATYLCGAASLMLNDTEAARREFAEAERLFADCGDAGYEGRTWLARADLARRTGDLKAARRLATRAAKRLEEHDETVPAAYANILLTEVVDSERDAAAHLARATRLVSTMDLAPLQLALDLAQARTLRRANQLEEAAQRLRTALARSLYAPRDATTDAELRIALHAAKADATDELIDLLLEHGTRQSVTEAWQRASATRIGTLNEYLQRASEEGVATRDPSAPDTGLADVSRLYEEMYGGMATSDSAVDATLVLRAREAELRLLEAVARGAAEPRSAAGRDRDRAGRRPPATIGPGPIPVPEGPVLQYHVLRNDVVAFVVREGQVHARRLRDLAEASRRLVRTWHAECSRFASASRVIDDLPSRAAGVEPLAELHRLLVAPIEDLVDDLYAQPLLVIPHQHLFGVPFEALADGGEPLCDRFRLAFCIGLSADSFAAVPAESKVDPGSTLVLGVPDELAPAISAEADLVATLRPDAEVFVGAGAMSRTLARRAAGKEVVHIACHAAFRPDNPMRSGLLLADGWLTAGQIVDLDLTDSLVVLSACASGRSSDTLVEPAGLAWAFAAAGCRAVVAAKWVIDDEATTEFMRAFYAQLATGLAPRDALERARAEIARVRPHPYYWAAFRYICSPAMALQEGLSP